MLYDAVLQQKQRDDLLIKRLESEISQAPEGRLTQSLQRGKLRLYRCGACAEQTREYLTSDRFAEIQQLAQKGYDEQVLKVLRQESQELDRLMQADYRARIREVYEQAPDWKKVLIRPIDAPDADYARIWQQTEYRGKPAGDAAFLTDRGEKVRSKSEVLIANALAAAGVPYRYECPLALKGLGVVHPDFTVLSLRNRKVLYWEHFGMMDDEAYRARAFRRIEGYEESGYLQGRNLITSFEGAAHPLRPQVIKNCICKYILDCD